MIFKQRKIFQLEIYMYMYIACDFVRRDNVSLDQTNIPVVGVVCSVGTVVVTQRSVFFPEAKKSLSC